MLLALVAAFADHLLYGTMWDHLKKARSGGRGAGLGLAIANRLVEVQGGIIMVESREGQGARFVVALPQGDRRSDRASETG